MIWSLLTNLMNTVKTLKSTLRFNLLSQWISLLSVYQPTRPLVLTTKLSSVSVVQQALTSTLKGRKLKASSQNCGAEYSRSVPSTTKLNNRCSYLSPGSGSSSNSWVPTSVKYHNLKTSHSTTSLSDRSFNPSIPCSTLPNSYNTDGRKTSSSTITRARSSLTRSLLRSLIKTCSYSSKSVRSSPKDTKSSTSSINAIWNWRSRLFNSYSNWRTNRMKQTASLSQLRMHSNSWDRCLILWSKAAVAQIRIQCKPQ